MSASADLTPAQFATAVLQGLGIQPTSANVSAMVGWINAEGGHWHNSARYNPLNTTQPAPGAGNTGTQGNIKVYTSWSQGVAATITTLKNGHYGGILTALGGNDPRAVASAIGSSPWGTGGGLVSKTIAAATASPADPGSLPGPGTPGPRPGTSAAPAPAKVDRGPWALRQLLAGALLLAGVALVYYGGARVLGVNGNRPVKAAAKAGAKAAVVIPK